jgi:signal transduction histidine kinase
MTDINRLNVPSELTAFKTALAGMLNRLNLFVDRQKQFTANAAHELRTPITLAKSTVQTALYQLKEKDHCQQAMTDILGDLDRMAGLIDQLQRLSNLDETEELFDTAQFSLSVLLQEIAQAHNHTSPGRVVTVGDYSVTVEGNKELLGCMFSNLVDNALVHGPEDRPVLIQMQPPSGNESVCVEIKDEGGEVPKEDVSRLTERFYRADSSRGRDTGGSGLGLAIANEIVKKHNGQLSIQSSPATGTCVRVTLPACTA